ncbi:hypothetical protein TDB9533_03877 [Thalassocella blandensis]|nr:hypothetical protein TDB9533_03877 [Thalassocella blandensis]
MKKKLLCTGLVACLLNACGGSGNDSDIPIPENEEALYIWEEGVYYASDYYKDLCEVPRTGNDPFNNYQPYPDEAGDYFDENFWLRSWVNELYLWYDEVDDSDPYLHEPQEYFDRLKTTETTASGTNKDDFHFTVDTFEYLTNSVSGVSFGYGMQLAFIQSSAPREVRVYDVVPGSPADLAGVMRGMAIQSIDDEDLIYGSNVDVLNRGISPEEQGERHKFVFKSYDDETLSVELESASITEIPVKYTRVVETDSGKVGYIHFNSHNYPAEAALNTAFSMLLDVEDLVLDLRYNGGGLLAIAAEVGFMIAGEDVTKDLDFYKQQFNDKYPNRNPVTGQPLQAVPFLKRAQGFTDDLAAGTQLTQLFLPRVYILATEDTCSASEAIINGLRGAGIDVYLIGSTTCGKPYGFYPTDNCGTTYFSIQFAGVNNDGFGDYANGFSPQNEPAAKGVVLPGCYVEDDFSKQLGDPEEGLFAAALQLRAAGTCPAVPDAAATKNKRAKANTSFDEVAPIQGRKAYLENMVLQP